MFDFRDRSGSMDGNMGSTCARCRVKIDCCANKREECECNKVTLDKSESEFIQMLFDDCLCNACLIELKKEYQRIRI